MIGIILVPFLIGLAVGGLVGFNLGALIGRAK